MIDIYKQLRFEEGVRKSAYQDHLGYWTIGVGRLIDARKNAGLSDDEIDYLLKNDVKRVRAQIEANLPWFAGLNDARQAVLIGMAFQMGVEGLLGFKQTLAAIQDEHYAHAGVLMLQSKWARQTPNRASRMARQIETGEWQSGGA